MRTLFIPVLATLIVAGCSESSNEVVTVESTTVSTDDESPLREPQELRFPTVFIDKASNHIAQFHQHSLKLQQSINQFLKNENNENWQLMKTNWLATHENWHLCDFHFAAIRKDQHRFPDINTTLGLLHSSPITAGYLDSIQGYPFSGLVNDITVPITHEAVKKQHQQFDESEVATGLHVLEFFLWGRSISSYDTSQNIVPGMASSTAQEHDITDQEAGDPIKKQQPLEPSDNKKVMNTTQLADMSEVTPNQKHQPVHRRREYLKVLGDLLVTDSSRLKTQWDILAKELEQNTPSIYSDTVTSSVSYQLQQLRIHSEHYANSNAGSHHWQLRAIEQLQRWIEPQGKTPIANQAVLSTTLKNLHNIFNADHIDTAILDSQLSALTPLE